MRWYTTILEQKCLSFQSSLTSPAKLTFSELDRVSDVTCFYISKDEKLSTWINTTTWDIESVLIREQRMSTPSFDHWKTFVSSRGSHSFLSFFSTCHPLYSHLIPSLIKVITIMINMYAGRKTEMRERNSLQLFPPWEASVTASSMWYGNKEVREEESEFHFTGFLVIIITRRDHPFTQTPSSPDLCHLLSSMGNP